MNYKNYFCNLFLAYLCDVQNYVIDPIKLVDINGKPVAFEITHIYYGKNYYVYMGIDKEGEYVKEIRVYIIHEYHKYTNFHYQMNVPYNEVMLR